MCQYYTAVTYTKGITKQGWGFLDEIQNSSLTVLRRKRFKRSVGHSVKVKQMKKNKLGCASVKLLV